MDEAGAGGTQLVTVEVSDGVALIMLQRPPMNALSVAVQSQVAAAAREVDQRRDVAAVVVYGGPKVFAAGADVKEMAEWDHATMVERSTALQAAFTAVTEIGKPTIAAITGYALGGGLELALCCDFRVCAENAKLGLPEIQLGIIPGAGGTQRLPRLIGPARAKEMIFSGRHVKADEALRIGLVDAVVPVDSVRDEAIAWASRYVGGPALALRAAKTAVDRGLEVDLRSGLEFERQQFASLFATHDRTIGMGTFLESGPGQATFEGR
ncbi:MAG TPA: enoyl-CoA hydratase-related protein [Candidatus Nanopelagicales bacterium]|nr:enoyl-CoA hydratase-related protein [Candidatus Nanopelagicales bacterium]